MHHNQVGIWRQRFAADGLPGLLDGDRCGRPPVYGHNDVLFAQRMADQGVAISASQAWRICQALDLKP